MIDSSFVKYHSRNTTLLVHPPIDETFVEIPATTLGQCSPAQTYPSIIHTNVSVTINLSYSLGCYPNYHLCMVNTTLQCVSAEEFINCKLYSLCGKLSLLPLTYTIKEP